MLNWLTSLFFSFHGRIPRKSYWLAQAILLIPGIAFYFVTHGLALPVDPTAPPPRPLLLLNLLLLIPALAVVVKRANDRGHSVWVTVVWLAMALVFVTASAFGFFADPKNFTHDDWVALAVGEVVALWFFIDLGCLRGDVGPNRFGPDPLGSAAPISVGQRRTTGENVRDALAGLTALIAVLSFAHLGIGLQPLIERIFIPAHLRHDLKIFQLRKANEPAMKAEKEGVAAYNAKDNESALQHFSGAIDLFGKEHKTAVPTYMWRAYVLERMNRLAEALADYDQALTIDPASTTAYQRRAALLTELGRYDQALKDLDAAREYEPDSASVYMDRGDTLAEAGRYDEAFVEYDKATKAANDMYKTIIWLHDKVEAIAPEEKHQELNEGFDRTMANRDELLAQVHMHRGNVFRMQKDRDKSLHEYAEALRLYPNFSYIYANRGWLYEQQGQLDLARTDYEKAATLDEPDEWLTRALERTRK